MSKFKSKQKQVFIVDDIEILVSEEMKESNFIYHGHVGNIINEIKTKN